MGAQRVLVAHRRRSSSSPSPARLGWRRPRASSISNLVVVAASPDGGRRDRPADEAQRGKGRRQSVAGEMPRRLRRMAVRRHPGRSPTRTRSPRASRAARRVVKEGCGVRLPQPRRPSGAVCRREPAREAGLPAAPHPAVPPVKTRCWQEGMPTWRPPHQPLARRASVYITQPAAIDRADRWGPAVEALAQGVPDAAGSRHAWCRLAWPGRLRDEAARS